MKTKPHPVFQRKNSDLLIRKRISLHEALCGYEFKIQHLDGRELVIKSKPGQTVANNSIKMLQDEGFPHPTDHSERGSLFVNFHVDFPAEGELTASQQTELRSILTGRPTYAKCNRAEDKEEFNLERANKAEYGQTKSHFAHGGGATQDTDSEDEEERGGGQRCRVQ